MKPKIMKVLYVEPGVDEKGGARMLEQSTEETNYSCAFTVVPNAFIGLECSEYTCFDLIIAKKDIQHLGATDMLNVLHAVGSPTPVVLLLDELDNMDEFEAQTLGFFSVLRKPLSTRVLCNLIETIMSRHGVNNSVPAFMTTQSSSTSSFSSGPNLNLEAASTSHSSSSMSSHNLAKKAAGASDVKLQGQADGVKPSSSTRCAAKSRTAGFAPPTKYSREGESDTKNRAYYSDNEGDGEVSKHRGLVSKPPDDKDVIQSSRSPEYGSAQCTGRTNPSSSLTSASIVGVSGLGPGLGLGIRPRSTRQVFPNEFSCLDEELLQIEDIPTPPCRQSPVTFGDPHKQGPLEITRGSGHGHAQVFTANSRQNANEILQQQQRQQQQQQTYQNVPKNTQLHSEKQNTDQNIYNTSSSNSNVSMKEMTTGNSRNYNGFTGNSTNESSSSSWQTQDPHSGSKKPIESCVEGGRKTIMPKSSGGDISCSMQHTQQHTQQHIQQHTQQQNAAWDPKLAAEQLVKEWSNAKTKGILNGPTGYPSLKSINLALLAVEENARLPGGEVNHNTEFSGQKWTADPENDTYLLTDVAARLAKCSKDPQLSSQYGCNGNNSSGSFNSGNNSGSGSISYNEICPSSSNNNSSSNDNSRNSNNKSPSPSPSMFSYTTLAASSYTAKSAPSPTSHSGYATLLPGSSSSSSSSTKQSLRGGIRRRDEGGSDTRQLGGTVVGELGRKRAPTDQGGYETFQEK